MSDRKKILFWIIVTTLVIELVTVLLRFGLALESTRDTASTIGVITFGLRVHHGYCGGLILLVTWGLSQQYPRFGRFGYIAGWSLILSDLVHHFLVLWPITGSPQFDFFYPQ